MFTGSRVSEYAQSKPKKGQAYAVVPSNTATEQFAGLPLAFITKDFHFYSKNKILLQYSKFSHAHFLIIRYRYTKGIRNFVHHTYAALPRSLLCPIQAAIRTLLRYHMIGPPPGSPLFCFLSVAAPPQLCYLKDSQVTTGLRSAVTRSFPDKRHICRQHISAITSKSIRVFACLCLKQAGWDLDSISHHLRWSSDAVKYYVRQAPFSADDISASLMSSATLAN